MLMEREFLFPNAAAVRDFFSKENPKKRDCGNIEFKIVPVGSKLRVDFSLLCFGNFFVSLKGCWSLTEDTVQNLKFSGSNTQRLKIMTSSQIML